MAKIVVSHSRKDPSEQEFIQPLLSGLAELGHQVYGFEPEPGEAFEQVLAQRVRDADLVVFVVSKAFLQSTWMKQEAAVAAAYADERGRPAVLPVAIGGVRFEEVPAPLNRFLILRAQRPDELLPQIVSALNRFAGVHAAEQEKRREVGHRVQASAAEYIRESLKELAVHETRYRRIGYACYAVTFVALSAAAGLALYRAAHPTLPEASWQGTVHALLLIAIAVALLVAMARFAFVLGKSFAVEALRNADRIHAIRFGEFYLKAFPEETHWAQVKEAFQHWNIDIGSVFREQTPSDFDPELLKKLLDLLKVAKKG